VLGSALVGWRADAAAFLPTGDLGAPLGAVAFHQLVGRRRAEGVACNFADYSLESLCAQTGRFALPHGDDRSVHATISYALHLDSAAFTQAMKGDAVARGVTFNAGRVVSALRGSDGLIGAVLTDRGEQLAGELFIDASGAGSTLHDEHGFEDWSAWLPCNRVASALRPPPAEPPCYVHVEAHPGGWQSFAPLQGALAEQFVFRDEACAGPSNAISFAPGRARAPWVGNCIAIGGAAAVIDPVAGLQFRLAQSAIIRLAGLIPAGNNCLAEAAEYNRQTCAELDRARDYAILFYALSRRAGDIFCDQARATALPDELAHRLALYRSCGRVALHDGDSVEEPGWITLFDAMGERPRRYDALANGIAGDALDAHFARIRAAMLAAVKAMPAHSETLRRMAK
jgi:tryptophan 7-halogenase